VIELLLCKFTIVIGGSKIHLWNVADGIVTSIFFSVSIDFSGVVIFTFWLTEKIHTESERRL
jgi:hypothetical protein